MRGNYLRCDFHNYRENISKLLRDQNPNRHIFRREIPQGPLEPVETRPVPTPVYQPPLDQPQPAPKLRPGDGEYQAPLYIGRNAVGQKELKAEKSNDLWKKQVNQYIQFSRQLSQAATHFQNCDELESLITCLQPISSSLRSAFHLCSFLFYSLDVKNTFSGQEYTLLFQEPDDETHAARNLQIEKVLPFFSEESSHFGLYRFFKCSDNLFTPLMQLLLPSAGKFHEETSIYIFDLSYEGNFSTLSKRYPNSIAFLIFQDPSTIHDDEHSIFAQTYLKDTLRTLGCYLDTTITRIHHRSRNAQIEFHENEIVIESEIRKYLHQAHYDYVLQEDLESEGEYRYSKNKLQSLIFSLTQLPLKFFHSPFSWIVLQNHQPRERGSTMSLFHIFDSIGECRIATENYLNLYERYSNVTQPSGNSPIGKLVLGAGLSEQNIAKPAIITTSTEVLCSIGLLTEPVVPYHSSLQLLVIPFTLSELNAMTDYSAFVIALPSNSAGFHDFVMEQCDLIIEMLLKCISFSRNSIQRNISRNLMESCDQILSNILCISKPALSTKIRDDNLYLRHLMNSFRNGSLHHAFRAHAIELLVPGDPSISNELTATFLGLPSQETDRNFVKLVIEEVTWMKTLTEGHPVILSNLQSRSSSSLVQYIATAYPLSKSAILYPIPSSESLSILVVIDILAERIFLEKFLEETRSEDRVLDATQCEHSLNITYVSPPFQEMISLIQRSQCLQRLQNILEFCMTEDMYVSEITTLFSQTRSQQTQLHIEHQELQSRLMKSRFFGFWKMQYYTSRESSLGNQVIAYANIVDSLFNLSTSIDESTLRQILLHGLQSLFACHRSVTLSVAENPNPFNQGNDVLHANIVDKNGDYLFSIQVTDSKLCDVERILVKQLSNIGSYLLRFAKKSTFKEDGTQTEFIDEDPIPASVILFLKKFLPTLFPKDLLTFDDFSQIVSYSSRFKHLAQEIIHFVTDVCGADIGLLRMGFVPQGLQYITKDILFSSEDPRPTQTSSDALHDVVEGILSRSDRRKRVPENQLTLRLFGLNGELQLFKADNSLSDQEQQFASIVSYFLIASSCFHDIKERYFKLKEAFNLCDKNHKLEIIENQELLHRTEQSLENYKLYFSLLKDFTSFTANILKVTSLEDLSNEINTNLSKYLWVKSAALYLRSEDPRLGEYQIVQSSEVEYENILTESQMRKYANFDWNKLQANPRISPFKRSKILLNHPQIAYPLGFILITDDFQELQSERGVTSECIDLDIHKDLLSIVTTRTCQILYHIQKDKDILQNYTPSHHFYELEAKFESLNDDNENLQEELNRSVEMIRKLQSENLSLSEKSEATNFELDARYQGLKNKFESLETEHSTLRLRVEQEKSRLERDLVLAMSHHQKLKEAYDSLETMILGYAIDSRFQPQHILSWLYEIAENMNLTLIPIHRGNRGEYIISSRSGELHGLSTLSLSLSNAIRESLRSCVPVEVTGTQSELLFSKKKNFQGSDLQSKFVITILCVPNRLAGSGLSAELSEARECVCYIFLRTDEIKFSEELKSYLNCAVGMVSKCLGVSTVARRNYPENIEALLQQTEKERESTNRVRESIEIIANFSSQNFNSWSEFIAAVEGIGNSILLTRHPTRSTYSYVVDGYVWQPGPQNTLHEYARSTFESMRGGVEMETVAHRVIANGKLLRNGNIMWVPLKISSGTSVAVLYLEKKIDMRLEKEYRLNFESADSEEKTKSGSLDQGNHIYGSISKDEMMFSDLDEEIMNFFSILSVATLDRFVHQRETLQSIQTASKAILTLQQSLAKLESGLATEISKKMKVEETLKIGSEILSTALLQR